MKSNDDQTNEATTDDQATHMVPILGLHPFVWTIGLMGIIVALIFIYSN